MWEFFKLELGVRQVCPMSAYLFILLIEMFANKTAQDKSIKGIKINCNEVKVNLLADDATCLLQDTESVKNVWMYVFIFNLHKMKRYICKYTYYI